MATVAEQGIATDSVLLRLVYEPPIFREGDVWQAGTWLAPPRSPSPILLWAAASLAHANEYLAASTVLAGLGSENASSLPGLRSDAVSISMQSPLVVLVALSASQVAAYGWALIKLAERICTFGPRVSRRRQEDLLAAAIARAQRQELEGEADAVARMIDTAAGETRLAHADLVDKPEDDDDLIEVR